MNVNSIRKPLALLVISMFISACGGGGGGDTGTSTTSNSSTISQNTLDPITRKSIQATADAMKIKIEEATFKSGKSIKAAGKSTTTDDYHLADVIFTLGTDDFTDEEANELKINAAYDYFKINVVDAGKLSDEDAESFAIMTVAEFNEAFVAGYYEATAPIVGYDKTSNLASVAILSAIPKYTTDITRRMASKSAAPRFFGFFKFFNPMTYLGIMINIAKTVMTAVLAQAFRVMLLSGTMTKFMLRLALKFPILTNVMINVLSSYWGITRQMIPYLKFDTEFGELFMQLAYEQSNMAHFVFQNIDAPLYYGMSVAMTRSQETTERLSVMMNWYSKIYFVNPMTSEPRYSNFVRLLLNTGLEIEADGETNHGDGNELANEKLYYSLFKSSFATGQFIAAMKQVEPNMLGALMDHIFLGQQRNPADGSLVVDDGIQGTYNIYAIAQGMLAGIEREGFGPYIQPLMDFALIIPQDRYIPYAQAFAMAGYSYYAQSLEPGSPPPTMEDFMQFLMGAISQKLGQIDPAYGEAAQAFGQMLQFLQPYIDEFMQNGLANLSSAAGSTGIVPDITQVTGTITDPITDPLQQNVQNLPDPSSMIDIIYKFPVLWEKDYSDGKFKGEHLSRFNNGKVWEDMSVPLSDLLWMDIPSTAIFSSTSTFDFIFKNGSVDMYIISNDYSVTWSYNGFSLQDTGETVTVKDTNFGTIDDFNPYKVYKVTIPAGTKLGDLHLLMPYVDGIAFDINNTKPVVVVTPDPTGPTTPPPTVITDPVDANNTVIVPVDPPVVVTPQVINMSDVINLHTLTFMSEADYSGSAFTNGLVNAPWWPGETWTAMPEWLSNLKWIDIDQNAYISSAENLNFIFDSGSVDMYLITTNSNLPWLLDMNGLSNVSLSSAIESTEGQVFYVFKGTMNANTSVEKLWLMMNYISGLAFDTSNVTLAP